MGVEPEQVLEQERISAEFGIEDAKMEEALDGHEHNGDGDYRRAEDHDKSGGVVGPDEERQTVPSEAGRAHAVDGDDEVESGKDRRKPREEDGESSFDDAGICVLRGEWAVESPTGVDAAVQHA